MEKYLSWSHAIYLYAAFCAEKFKSACVKWYKPYLFFVLVYGLAINTIVRANFNYIDDLGRVAAGYRNWVNFSRYISEYLAVLIHTDYIISDISPLPQYIAVLLMALASLLLVITFSQEKSFSFCQLLAVLPMGLSPYFLECFSYKFDAPYMALSVLAGIFPLLLLDSKKIIFLAAVLIGTLVMCTTYQASSGIFMLALIFLLAKRWNEGEKIRQMLASAGISLGAYLLGIIIFRKVMMRSVSGYVTTDMPGASNIMRIITQNLARYYKLLYQDSTYLWVFLFAGICLLFVISFVAASKRNRIVSFMLAATLLAAGSALSYGGYLLLEKPLFAPRGMYGFGVFVALAALVSVSAWQKNFLAKIFCVLLSWSLFTFAFAYGNALAEQKRYTDFRVHIVLNDLAKLPHMDAKHVRKIQIEGNIGKSPIIARVGRRYKVLNRLVPNTLGAGWVWSETYFYKYFSLRGIKVVPSYGKNEKLAYKKLPVFADSLYHTIYANGKQVVVRFK